jgi:hypothetical protein
MIIRWSGMPARVLGVQFREGARPDDVAVLHVGDAVFAEHLADGFHPPLVPDVVEPAMRCLFVLRALVHGRTPRERCGSGLRGL